MFLEKNRNYLFFERLLPNKKNWYTVKEVAAILESSEQYVRDCFDSQKILGHTWNGKAKKGEEKRKTYRISRESLILFFMETANYCAEEFLTRLQKAEQSKA